MKKLLCLILVLLSALCLFSSCKDNDHKLDITQVVDEDDE